MLVAAMLLTAPGLATPEPAHAERLDEMCEELQAEAAGFDGRISFVVQDLTDGTSCTRNPDEVYTSASLYKLIVLAEAHRQQEAGLFSFDETVGGLNAAEAIRLMIQVSDNDTAHALLRRLGSEDVAALAGQLGMSNTLIRVDADEDHTTTADDIALFFVQLQSSSLISPEADEAMLELLVGQTIRDRIPALLPANVRIAHKTGRLDLFAHDAGIVYAPGGPYLLVLLTEGSRNWNQGSEAIRTLAALSYTAYASPPGAATSPAPAASPAPAPAPSSVPEAASTVPAGETPVPLVAVSSGAGRPGDAATAAADSPAALAAATTPTAAPGGDGVSAPDNPATAPAPAAPVGATTPAAVAPGGNSASAPGSPATGAAAVPAAPIGATTPAPVAPGGSGASRATNAPIIGSADSPWWVSQPVWIALLGALTLASLLMLAQRRRRDRQLAVAPLPEFAPSPVSRLGGIDYRGRRSALGQMFNGGDGMWKQLLGGTGEPGTPNSPSDVDTISRTDTERSGGVHEPGAPDLAPSAPRLQRLAAYFGAQRDLLERMSSAIASENDPLAGLLERQSKSAQLVLAALEERLGPLREYADSESANLSALRERIKDDGMEFIARSFSDYMSRQHERISEMRQRIESQREPFEQLALDQRNSVDRALARFDSDVEALERNLAEQNHVLTQLLDALRSDEFSEVVGLLSARQESLDAAAASGVTDPAEIASRMEQVLADQPERASRNGYLGDMLGDVEEADRRLRLAGETPGMPAAADAGPPEDAAAEDEGAQGKDAEAEDESVATAAVA